MVRAGKSERPEESFILNSGGLGAMFKSGLFNRIVCTRGKNPYKWPIHVIEVYKLCCSVGFSTRRFS